MRGPFTLPRPRCTGLSLGALLVAALAPSRTNSAQGASVSTKEALFVPVEAADPADSRVPLSEFRSVTPGTLATLSVRAEILQWAALQTSGVEIALRSAGAVTFVPAGGVDVGAGEYGTVTYSPSVAGDVVVVHGQLLNDFGTSASEANGIVTHWDETLNGNRGGHRLGATDGISNRDYDPATGDWLWTNYLGHGNSNPSWADQGSVYYWASDTYALFSDGSEGSGTGVELATVPSYERYIAENWSLQSVTKLAAIRLSDLSREATGLPLAHRNHPAAFNPSAPAYRRVQEGLPILQVVHAYLVGYDDPNLVGRENSLATFFVPPGWSKTPTEPYAVLFNTYYDIHTNTFEFDGPGGVILRTLGELYNEDGKQAIGVTTNGGGSAGTVSLQGSSIYNAQRLFSVADRELRADRTRVVVTGASRGAYAGLTLASMPATLQGVPVPQAFTATFVIAGAPNVFPGEALAQFNNPTYPLVQESVNGIVGYTNAHQEGWTKPGTNTHVQELSALNILGTSNFGLIDAELALGSPDFVESLATKGTTLVLRVGTHDESRPFSHITRYLDELVAHGVKKRVEISYRAGHGGWSGTGPTQRELLNLTIDGLPLDPADEGIFHFRQDESTLVVEEFLPAHAPVFLEAPLIVPMTHGHTYSITGPPGTRYRVLRSPIEMSWLPAGVPPEEFDPYTIPPVDLPPGPALFLAGILPSSVAGISSWYHTFDPDYAPDDEGFWRLELQYLLPQPGATWTVVNHETSCPDLPGNPGSYYFDPWPVLWLRDQTPDPANHEKGFSVGSRVGGVSEDVDL